MRKHFATLKKRTSSTKATGQASGYIPMGAAIGATTALNDSMQISDETGF
jgi:hypothetical protein